MLSSDEIWTQIQCLAFRRPDIRFEPSFSRTFPALAELWPICFVQCCIRLTLHVPGYLLLHLLGPKPAIKSALTTLVKLEHLYYLLLHLLLHLLGPEPAIQSALTTLVNTRIQALQQQLAICITLVPAQRRTGSALSLFP